jgi:hypothetical protein
MVTLEIKGYVDENGELRARVPEGFPPGEVKIHVVREMSEQELASGNEDLEEDAPLTEDEIRELLKPNPKTGAEIAEWLKQSGGWDKNTPDGATWVEEQRRKRRERNQ